MMGKEWNQRQMFFKVWNSNKENLLVRMKVKDRENSRFVLAHMYQLAFISYMYDIIEYQEEKEYRGEIEEYEKIIRGWEF